MLRSEAEFQNRRVSAAARGEDEARDKFYYLLDGAMRDYDRALGDLEGRRVLVVGCSEGGVTPLARRGAIVTGIDIADQAIAHLNEAIRTEGLADRASALVMNAEEPEFPDGTFDVICCSGVLHHLIVERAAAGWRRVLKPGGRVAMVEPMAWNPAVLLFRLLTPSMRTADEHPLTPRDIRTLERHFAEVEVTGYALTSLLSLVWVYLPDPWSLKERSKRWLEALDTRLLRLFPFLKYFCWSSVIRLSGARG